MRQAIAAALDWLAAYNAELPPTARRGQPRWLRFLAALHHRLGVNIPEADYQQLTTMDVLLAYLQRRLAE